MGKVISGVDTCSWKQTTLFDLLIGFSSSFTSVGFGFVTVETDRKSVV